MYTRLSSIDSRLETDKVRSAMDLDSEIAWSYEESVPLISSSAHWTTLPVPEPAPRKMPNKPRDSVPQRSAGKSPKYTPSETLAIVRKWYKKHTDTDRRQFLTANKRGSRDYLSLLLSGYDLASETWANNTYEKQRTVFNFLTSTTTKAYNNITSRPEYWSIKLGSGTPGPEVQGFQHGMDTPFANPGEMHACCVELTSPIFGPTNEGWQDFATGLNRILARLEQPGILHSRPRMPSTHRHLAWTNESCDFSVSVLPRSKKHHVSWPALQNLFVVWETCAEEIERLTYQQQQQQQQPSYSSPQPPLRKESYLKDFAEALYDIPTLQTYTHLLSSPALTSPQHLPSNHDKISLLTDRSGTYCTSLRFHQHPSTLYLPAILFWTRFTYTAVLKCQSLAVWNRRIEMGSGMGWLDFMGV
ncbi:MAG: hypothetical protein Q9172_004263 [Xanthocarpia lactea]